MTQTKLKTKISTAHFNGRNLALGLSSHLMLLGLKSACLQLSHAHVYTDLTLKKNN